MGGCRHVPGVARRLEVQLFTAAARQAMATALVPLRSTVSAKALRISPGGTAHNLQSLPCLLNPHLPPLCCPWLPGSIMGDKGTLLKPNSGI